MLNNKLKKLQQKIDKLYPGIRANLKDDCVVLSGTLNEHAQIVEVGLLAAATHHFYGVINEIKLAGFIEPKMHVPTLKDQAYDGIKCEVLVIGGGIVGAAILRELSKYQVEAILIEKENDLALQASSRNDGCIHVGVDLAANSKKLHYLQQSIPLYPSLAKDLGVEYHKCGQMVTFEKPIYRLARPVFALLAKRNKIKEVQWLNSLPEVQKYEPNVSKNVTCGVLFGTGAVVCPYNMTIALAENAVTNGAKVLLNTAVLAMTVKDQQIEVVETNRGRFYPKVVINAAGVFADKVAQLAKDQFFTIHPRKGTNSILDKKSAVHLSTTSLSMLSLHSSNAKQHTKGGGVVLTADKNPLVGPTAHETPLREDFTVEGSSIDEQFNKHKSVMPNLNKGDIITYFSGIRAATYEEDFIVEKGKWTKNIVHAAGIQSPGITAAPAIAIEIVRLVQEVLGKRLPVNPNFNGKRQVTPPLNKLSLAERNEYIQANPLYGQIVCRCEEISQGEIIDALNRPIVVNSLDGIKRRVRAGMGRCQGGFCQPLVLQIMAEQQHKKLTDITKKGEASVLLGAIKEGYHE